MSYNRNNPSEDQRINRLLGFLLCVAIFALLIAMTAALFKFGPRYRDRRYPITQTLKHNNNAHVYHSILLP